MRRALKMLLASPRKVETELLWWEDHETNDPTPLLGRLPSWYIGQSSPNDDSADGGTSATRPSDGAVMSQHHSGSWAMRTNIAVTSSGTAGCRTNYKPALENTPLRALYYGAWYYIPTRVAVGGFWQHMQFKVRNSDQGTAPYVAWALYIINPSTGVMSYRLSYKLGDDAGIPGPQVGGPTTVTTYDSEVPVPEATWYHLEVYFKPSVYPDYNGRITVRLDGVEIFDINNTVTLDQAEDRFNVWHITNYGTNLGTGDDVGDGAATIVLFNDDETIAEGGWVYGSSVAPWA